MGDNLAVSQGFTKEVMGEGGEFNLFLQVKPDTDFDSTFKAWDTDAQEWIRVNGWLFEFSNL